MARLHLVRHGRASAGWGDHADPGLSERGLVQAASVADILDDQLEPRSLISSPLRRARETAIPLAERWGIVVAIDPAFGEIPSPTDDLDARQDWLSSALASRWSDLGPEVERWRDDLVLAATGVPDDAVVFTHFVAINALVAAATADDAVTVFLPANASVTEIEVLGPGRMRVVDLGREATPEVG